MIINVYAFIQMSAVILELHDQIIVMQLVKKFLVMECEGKSHTPRQFSKIRNLSS